MNADDLKSAWLKVLLKAYIFRVNKEGFAKCNESAYLTNKR